jgi:hypothetical protein
MRSQHVAVCILGLFLTAAATADHPSTARDLEAVFESLVATGSKDDDDFVAYAAWLPTELFDLLARQAPPSQQLDEDRDAILKSVSPHVIFALAHAEYHGGKELGWATPDELFRDIEITYVDLEGQVHAIPKASRVKPLAQAAVAPMQRVLVEAFGANASHFFFWYGEALSTPSIGPFSRGRLVVSFHRPNGKTVSREIALPLATFVEPLANLPRASSLVDEAAGEEKPAGPEMPKASQRGQLPTVPDRQLADECENRALQFQNRGEHDQAIALIDRSIVARGGAQQIEDLAVRAALAMKAKSLLELARVDESEATLSFLHAEPGGAILDPHRAAIDSMAWSTLQNIYLLRKDYARAYQALISIRQCKSADSIRNPTVATQHKMVDGCKAARILIGLNELDAAQKELDCAWDIYRSNFATDDGALKMFANTYGELAEKRGDFATAETRYAEAEQLAMKSEGPSSPARLRAMACRHRVCSLADRVEEVVSIERQAANLVVSGYASTRALVGFSPQPAGKREIDSSLSAARPRGRWRYAVAAFAMIGVFFLAYGGIGSLFRQVGGRLWWSAAKLSAAFCFVLLLNTGLSMSGGRPIHPLNMPFALLFAWWAVRGITSAYKQTDVANVSRYASPRLTAGLACMVISLVTGPLAFLANIAVSGGERRYPTPIESEIYNLGLPCLVAMTLAGLFCFLVGVGERASAFFSSRKM